MIGLDPLSSKAIVFEEIRLIEKIIFRWNYDKNCHEMCQ